MMNRFLNIYLMLPHDKSLGLFTKVLNRLTSKLFKIILDNSVPSYFLKTQNKFPVGINKELREKKLLISLTSFPARIDDVWIVIECIFRQTYKADKIILWLDEEKFTLDSLPQNLKNQLSRGLEVILVKDYRSHTKYFYALQQFSDYHVITLDDDCYYPDSIISNLINISQYYPDSIVSNRIHKMEFENMELKPYKMWHHNFSPNKMINGKYFLTGVCGVLYPPNVFNAQVFDSDKFMEICKFADDVWLTFNAFKMNLSVASNNTFNKDMISISKSSDHRLLNYNSKENGNDQQIIAVMKHLGLSLTQLILESKEKSK